MSHPTGAEAADPSLLEKAAQIAMGIGMLGVAVGGVALATEHTIDFSHSLAITTDSAQPSSGLSDAFEAAVAAGTALGAAVIAKRGGHHLRVALSPTAAATDQMAHADRTHNRGSIGRTVAGGSLIVLGAGAMVGNFVDTAHQVSHSQSNVAGYFNDILGSASGDSGRPFQDTFVISNSPVPELANNPNISITKANGFLSQAKQHNITAVPVSYEWHSGQRKDQPDTKIQLLTASLPDEMTGLPKANQECSDVSVSAAKELGVAKGETFTMDGLTLTVREVLEDKAGLNLLPVLFNNSDFARCVRNNPDELFTTILAKGDQQQIIDLLKAQGLSADNLSNRAFVIPTSQFVDNTQQTGENSVDPLVLQALAVASIVTGAAMGNRAMNRLAEKRRQNTVLNANGMDKHMISRMAVEIAESEAFRSSIVAMPVVLLVDAYTNGGIPGAALGPSINTMLCVLGVNWGVNRAGTAIAMRREAPKINMTKGHIL